MELKCAKNETLIKSWAYAKSKKWTDPKEYELAVTDKRIIAYSESSKSIDRKEIYLKDVKTLEYAFAKNGILGAILLLILGIPLCFAIIGIFMVVKAVGILTEKSFNLSIVSYGEDGEGLNLGTPALSRRQSKIKVKVDKTAITDIINLLGAIVVDIKENGVAESL